MKSLITNTWEKPYDALIQDIACVLDDIFSKPECGNMARLAVLAIYQCLTQEVKRFEGKSIWAKEKALSTRAEDQRIWDLEVLSSDGLLFEAVLVHSAPIRLELVKNTESILHNSSVDRVYLLSTVATTTKELILIGRETERINSTCGYEVIIGGVIPTIEYFLRSLRDTNEFIESYVNLLDGDKSIKFEHQQRWNELIERLG